MITVGDLADAERPANLVLETCSLAGGIAVDLSDLADMAYAAEREPDVVYKARAEGQAWRLDTAKSLSHVNKQTARKYVKDWSNDTDVIEAAAAVFQYHANRQPN